ncbi:metallophosphoesterase [Amorphus sp. 3PC139-8]|uniref:metallophosphoesterase family protein n=1 Tax=Amorphus sp. 3PC139-8 TaxID=2735676 RepID=UPI00345D9C87
MYTLAHLSDPHLGPLPQPKLRELASKRVIGYVNWRRNRVSLHLEEPLARLVDDMLSTTPDHIAVTGDLVNLALKAEIETARQWLGALGPARDVSVIPGNHDAYVPGALGHAWRSWADHMTDDAKPLSAAGERFPFIRRRGPIAVVGTSSAVATGPFMATGSFGPGQAQRLTDCLRGLGKEGLFRVVMVHHPPLSGATGWYKRLVGGSRFRAAVREAGAELVLHGHTHRRSIGWIGHVPVIGVPAASNAGHAHGAGYNLFRIGGEPNAWQVEMIERGLSGPSAPVIEMDRRHLYRDGRIVNEATRDAAGQAAPDLREAR